MLMTKGLMERSLHHEMTLGRVHEKAKLAEEELFELRNWKVVTEQKLKLVERARDEYQKMTEELKKVLEDKKNDLRHAKKAAVLEYCDSDALLSELGAHSSLACHRRRLGRSFRVGARTFYSLISGMLPLRS